MTDTDLATDAVAPPAASEARRQKAWFKWIATFAALAIGVGAGWFAADQLQSPAQRQAAAAAPSPGPVLASITSGVLSTEVSARASIARTVTASYRIASAASIPVVTAVLVKAGDVVGAGRAVLAVADRPVFALPGEFAPFRDMTEGDHGTDIAQLQAGLKAAGAVIPSSENTTFGDATAAAVKSMYAAAGFAAPVSDGVVRVPRGEVVVVAGAFPVTVEAIPHVGELASDEDAAITVVGGATVARAEVSSGVVVSIRPGSHGYVQGPDGKQIDAQVTKVLEGDEQSGASPSIELSPMGGGAAFPEAWLGGEALAVVTIQAVDQVGLIVPSRAIATGSDGVARVAKFIDGLGQLIAVEDLGDLSGQSVIRPVKPGDLSEGDQVQVG